MQASLAAAPPSTAERVVALVGLPTIDGRIFRTVSFGSTAIPIFDGENLMGIARIDSRLRRERSVIGGFVSEIVAMGRLPEADMAPGFSDVREWSYTGQHIVCTGRLQCLRLGAPLWNETFLSATR